MSAARDPTDLREREREAEADDAKARETQRREDEDFKWLMAHAQGRRYLWRLLEQAGVYRTSFHVSGSQMAFNEGQRNIGLRLIADIHRLAPEGYVKLLRENRND